MPKLRVHNFAMSLDGYVAGPHQSLDNPLGEGGMRLHEWVLATRTFQRMHLTPDSAGGTTGIDDDFIARGDQGIGATIMGRNMFGPVRGPWAPVNGEDWRGWWGEDPPYHHPVFVLTHYPHEPIEMAGGTTFHFVTDGIEATLHRAFEAAGGNDVRLGGGASIVRQYLRAGLVDQLHVAVVPILLGAGEPLFDPADAPLNLDCVEFAASDSVAHVVFARS